MVRKLQGTTTLAEVVEVVLADFSQFIMVVHFREHLPQPFREEAEVVEELELVVVRQVVRVRRVTIL